MDVMRVQDGPFPLNRVIEKLATSDKAYDPYGPGVEVLDDVMGFQEPVTHHSDDVTEV